MRAMPVVVTILLLGSGLAYGQDEKVEESQPKAASATKAVKEGSSEKSAVGPAEEKSTAPAAEPPAEKPSAKETAGKPAEPAPAEESDEAPAEEKSAAPSAETAAKKPSATETAEKSAESAPEEESGEAPASEKSAAPSAETAAKKPSAAETAEKSAEPAPAEGSDEAPAEEKDTAVSATASGKEEAADRAATEAPAADSAAGEAAAAATEGDREEVAVLEVLSDPSGAVIVVDGEVKGKTPLKLDSMMPGDHAFEIRRKGYFLKRATVRVAPGVSEKVKFVLSKPVELIVTSTPAGARVALGGDSVGVTPFGDATLKPASYEVTVSAGGYQPLVRNISLEERERDSVHVDLVKIAAEPSEEETAAAPRRGKGRLALLDKVALAVFLAFSVVILTIELAGTRE